MRTWKQTLPATGGPFCCSDSTDERARRCWKPSLGSRGGVLGRLLPRRDQLCRHGLAWAHAAQAAQVSCIVTGDLDKRCTHACRQLTSRSSNPLLRHSWRQHRRSVWHMPQLFRHFVGSPIVSCALLALAGYPRGAGAGEGRPGGGLLRGLDPPLAA